MPRPRTPEILRREAAVIFDVQAGLDPAKVTATDVRASLLRWNPPETVPSLRTIQDWVKQFRERAREIDRSLWHPWKTDPAGNDIDSSEETAFLFGLDRTKRLVTGGDRLTALEAKWGKRLRKTIERAGPLSQQFLVNLYALADRVATVQGESLSTEGMDDWLEFGAIFDEWTYSQFTLGMLRVSLSADELKRWIDLALDTEKAPGLGTAVAAIGEKATQVPMVVKTKLGALGKDYEMRLDPLTHVLVHDLPPAEIQERQLRRIGYVIALLTTMGVPMHGHEVEEFFKKLGKDGADKVIDEIEEQVRGFRPILEGGRNAGQDQKAG